MTALHHRSGPRLRAALLLPAVGLGLLAGCSATNPATTTMDYAASDGVDLTLGDLDVGNLLVLAAAEDAPGTVLGSVTNTGDDDATVTVGLTGEDGARLRVDAGETVILGPDGTAVDLDAVPVAPGALVELTLASDAAGTTSIKVPVLDGAQEQYADLVPEG